MSGLVYFGRTAASKFGQKVATQKLCTLSIDVLSYLRSCMSQLDRKITFARVAAFVECDGGTHLAFLPRHALGS